MLSYIRFGCRVLLFETLWKRCITIFNHDSSLSSWFGFSDSFPYEIVGLDWIGSSKPNPYCVLFSPLCIAPNNTIIYEILCDISKQPHQPSPIAVNNPEQAAAACFLVRNLCFSHAENRLTLGLLGACEAVVSALKRFGTDKNVCEKACWAMGNLAIDDRNNAALGKAGACEAVYVKFSVCDLGSDIVTVKAPLLYRV
jgi:hypothetical protein